MSTIQNLKNFIRHGKQARAAHPAHGEPATGISDVHAHQHHNHRQHGAGMTDPRNHAHSEPNVEHQRAKPLQADVPAGDYSVGAVGNKNVGARAADAAAHVAADNQRLHQQAPEHRKSHDRDAARRKAAEEEANAIEKIVAEERDGRGKLPRYPGLDRWILLEKMGDGAFSNVYRAKDGAGKVGEVAIKVVRKFEMNSTQVSIRPFRLIYYKLCASSSFAFEKKLFQFYGQESMYMAFITLITPHIPCLDFFKTIIIPTMKSL